MGDFSFLYLGVVSELFLLPREKILLILEKENPQKSTNNLTWFWTGEEGRATPNRGRGQSHF